jgi:hypothetical protein
VVTNAPTVARPDTGKGIAQIVWDHGEYARKTQKAIEFWKKLEPEPWILSVLENGLNLSFVSTVPNIFALANNASAVGSAAFVKKELCELRLRCAISAVPEEAVTVCSPLSVAVNGKGKQRLVLDLSRLNKHVGVPHFHLDDLRSVWFALETCSHAACFDFRSGYHHIPVSEGSRKYLGFFWEDDGVRQYYVFNVLPFGYSPAPFVFHKFFRPLIKKWRKQGIVVSLYLDDGLVLGRSESDCQRSVEIVRRDLDEAGVTLADEKCMWGPVKQAAWLGYTIDLERKLVSVSEQRIGNTLEALRVLVASDRPTLKQRRIVLGCLSSMHLVLDGRESLCTGPLLDVVADSQQQNLSGKARIELTVGERQAAELWTNRLQEGASRSYTQRQIDCEIESDASASGGGAILLEGGKKIDAFSSVESEVWREQSSTYRELHAILQAVMAFSSRLRGKRLIIKCDNQGVTSILRKGSMKPHLRKLAVQIRVALDDINCEMSISWIPRDENQIADYFSRAEDYDDWVIQDAIFRAVQRRFGATSFDAFADATNSKHAEFAAISGAAKWPDFFECVPFVTRIHRRIWCVPPPMLTARLLATAKLYEVDLILGVPKWETSAFYPLLKGSCTEWAEFVKGVWEFPINTKLIKPGPVSSNSRSFSSPFLHFPFLFLHIQFRPEALSSTQCQ